MKIIRFSPPDVGEEEAKAMSEAVLSGWITTGPRTRLLEQRLSAYVFRDGGRRIDAAEECPRALCVNSATAAEELALRLLGIGPGDEVIVPAYTFSATASAVLHVGATPVIVDIQKGGDASSGAPEMDYDRLESAFTERTKAVVAVDVGGLACDYRRIFDIAERQRSLFRPAKAKGDILSDMASRLQHALGRVAVLGDCAHSLGAYRLDEGELRMSGDLADFSSFSFHAVKNFTTAEGGALLWRSVNGIGDREIFKMLQLLSLHGQSRDAMERNQDNNWEYDILGPWYKCNMTDITAAMGLVQLDRYHGMLERRKALVNRYDQAMDRIGIWHVKHETKLMSSSRHLYMTRLPGISESERNRVIQRMAQEGVMLNVHFKPLPMMTAYRSLGFSEKDYPNACEYYRNEITLPLYSKLTDEEVERVIECYGRIAGEFIQDNS